MERKTVGIILREFDATYKNIPLYGIGRDILDFLRKYDINVICVPMNFCESKKSEDNLIKEFENVKSVIDFCDGIIFPGGFGISELDCKVVRYLSKIDKPTLGICLGMQTMAKAFEGEVIENGADELHADSNEYSHYVTIEKNSKLYEILGETKVLVNSRHYDYVKYTKLDCVAKSEDGLIEAIEYKGRRFFMGVQWHPESIINDVYSNKLFDYFMQQL